MLHRFFLVVVVAPLAILLVVLAVANRATTPFTLNPFDPGSPGLTIHWPLFVYLFITLILGVVLGSLATWFRQGRYRKIARERTHEAEQLRRKAAEREERAVALAPADAEERR